MTKENSDSIKQLKSELQLFLFENDIVSREKLLSLVVRYLTSVLSKVEKNQISADDPYAFVDLVGRVTALAELNDNISISVEGDSSVLEHHARVDAGVRAGELLINMLQAVLLKSGGISSLDNEIINLFGQNFNLTRGSESIVKYFKEG